VDGWFAKVDNGFRKQMRRSATTDRRQKHLLSRGRVRLWSKVNNAPGGSSTRRAAYSVYKVSEASMRRGEDLCFLPWENCFFELCYGRDGAVTWKDN
jgi:hypothetical protein